MSEENREDKKSQKDQKRTYDQIFEQINFEEAEKFASNMTAEDREKMLKSFLFDFPIQNYAIAINEIFKLFKATNDKKSFVDAMKQHLKNKGK